MASDYVESLKHISQVQRSQFDLRQKVEWRVLITALTFYLAAAIGVDRLSYPEVINLALVNAVYIIFTVTILLWLLQVHMNHFLNKHAAHAAENKLLLAGGINPETLFDNKGHGSIVDRTQNFLCDQSKNPLQVTATKYFYFGCQFVIVLVFSLSSCLFVRAVVTKRVDGISSTNARIKQIEALHADFERKLESIIKTAK